MAAADRDIPAGPDEPAGLIAIGRIGPAHGNQGAAFVEPWTDAPEERFAAGAVLRTDPEAAGPLTVASHRLNGDRLIVQFAGVDDREAIQALRATLLMIPAAARPRLEDPDEFYDSDLVGLQAVSTEGAALGAVLAIVHLAGAVYLQLQIAGTERLVPFVSTIVPEVDLPGGRVVIDVPEGLFDL
jgi:16S rRNA processing protein RimM